MPSRRSPLSRKHVLNSTIFTYLLMSCSHRCFERFKNNNIKLGLVHLFSLSLSFSTSEYEKQYVPSGSLSLFVGLSSKQTFLALGIAIVCLKMYDHIVHSNRLGPGGTSYFRSMAFVSPQVYRRSSHKVSPAACIRTACHEERIFICVPPHTTGDIIFSNLIWAMNATHISHGYGHAE